MSLTDYNQLDNDKIRLLIKLRQKELEIKKIELEIEKMKAIPVPIVNVKPKVKIKLSLKIRTLNFGQELCDMLETIQVLSDLTFISQICLEIVHFNTQFPQNWNLNYKDSSSEFISVYINDQWQEIYIDLVIDEYIKGNIMRLTIMHPSHTDYFQKLLQDDEALSELQYMCKKSLAYFSQQIFK